MTETAPSAGQQHPAIHLAQSFEKIRLRLTVMVEHLRLRHYPDAADALKAKWERHCGVNTLSLSLWPTPSLSQQQTQQAVIELSQLIEKQYAFWIENRSAFPIPAEFAPPATKDDLTRNSRVTSTAVASQFGVRRSGSSENVPAQRHGWRRAKRRNRLDGSAMRQESRSRIF
jgi:hypothetical protein